MPLYNFNFHPSQKTNRSRNIYSGWGAPNTHDRYDAAEQLYDLFLNENEISENLPQSLPPYQSGKSRRLWHYTRKVLGKDTPHYAQHEGSCVAFGAKNAGEYRQCAEIATGEKEEFHPLFPPYLYGTGRVYVGAKQVRDPAQFLSDDGSFGNWQMVACAKYGFLRSDLEGVPEYPQGRPPSNPKANTLGRMWGKDDREWKQFVDIADDHTVPDKSRIRTPEDLCRFLVSGVPCTIASSQGFTMKPDSRGLHRPSGTWHHQMCFIGCIHYNNKTYYVILNSWGNIHGITQDPETGEQLPPGVLLVELDRAIADMISRGECYPYMDFKGFKDLSDDLDDVTYDLF